jgi:glyceraldehyde 3-phosphate dehydrogenase
MIKVGINGFGRIGRLAFREITESDKMEVVAINDLSSPAKLAYLLKYDSNQGTFKKNVTHNDHALIIDGKPVAAYAERDPHNLP